jgi:hypothetical protein
METTSVEENGPAGSENHAEPQQHHSHLLDSLHHRVSKGLTLTVDPERLAERGYSLVPISPGAKAPPSVATWPGVPALLGWSTIGRERPLERWTTIYPGCGWGFLCDQIVGVDLDEDEPVMAAKLHRLAVDHLGVPGMVREGRPNRKMLVYRASGHIRTAKATPVDILARNEASDTAAQFVAFHIHPNTGRPYRWLGADPHDVDVDELPAITQAQVDGFLQAVEALVGRPEGRAPGQPRNLEWTTDDTGTVIDGREAWLTHLVWKARDESNDPTTVAEIAWEEFQRTADTSRPHGKRPWGYKDALAKARGTLRKQARSNEQAKPDPWPDELPVEVAAARLETVLTSFLTEGVRENRRQLIRGAAGLGKSRQTLNKLAELYIAAENWNPAGAGWLGRTTWFLTKTTKLAVELAGYYKGQAVVIYGRLSTEQEMCARPQVVLAAQKAGVRNIQQTLCKRKDAKTKTELRCPHFDTCWYQAQFSQKADVYFMSHEYMHVVMSREMDKPGLLVIDEDPLPALYVEKDEDPAAFVEGAGAYTALAELLVTELRANRDPRPALKAEGYTASSLTAVAKALGKDEEDEEGAAEIDPTAADEEIMARLKVRRWPLAGLAFRRLAEEMNLERAGVRSVTLARSEKKTTDGETISVERLCVQYRRKPRQLHKDLPVLILDATAEPRLLAPTFTGLQVESIESQRPKARVVQSYGQYAGKGALTTKQRAEALRQEVGRFLERLSSGMASAGGLLVTHKDARDLIPLPEGKVPLGAEEEASQWVATHFGALRGIDAYRERDVVVVLGQPLPPVQAVERIASGLLYDSEDELTLTGAYQKREIGWRTKPGVPTRAVPRGGVWYHPDPTCEAVRRSQCEAEVIQAVDRLRLRHRERSATVYLLTGFPTLPADELVPFHALVERPVDAGRRQGPGPVYRLGKAVVALGGYLPLAANWLQRRFPRIWATAKAVEKDVAASASNLGVNSAIGTYPKQNPLAPISILLGTRGLMPAGWHFRVEGQRGRPTRLLTPASADETAVRTWLAEHVGQVVMLERIEPLPPATEDEDPFTDLDDFLAVKAGSQ